MTALQTLLVATDLSAPSRHAAMRAAILAKQSGARLELVHVLEKNALDELRLLFGGEGDALQDRIRLQGQEALAQLAADIGERSGAPAGFVVLEGTVLDSCIAHAENLDASLLIVGARGAGFMRHWLLGATTERLLRRTLRPVLVVKQPPHEPYRSVLVSVDFSPWSLGAIRLAQAVAPQATLILLHTVEMPFEGKMRVAGVEDDMIRQHRDAARRDSLARLHQTATDAGLASARWLPIVLHGDAAPRILEQEEEMGADLIVLGKHGAGVAEELLLGSVTKHVLAQARCDVLVAQR
jgi:nucleotide-binding universal stress UspA family protein